MPMKKGVTGVVFFREKNELLFLLLHRCLNWSGWEFPKGGVEEGEDPHEAVLREVSEETSLKGTKIVSRLDSGITWSKGETTYVYNAFLVKAKSKGIVFEQKIVEHDDFKWVSAKDAKELLTHNENKVLLEKALDFLSRGVHEVHAVVSGKVQGVFFRAFAKEAADEIGGITGFAKNLHTGEVEILAQGKKRALLEFLKKIKKGPPLAKVQKVKEEWEKPTGILSGFEIKR